MYSPQDRIYNTPDVSIPAANAILQQLRLERVLRRIGYFTSSKQHDAFPINLPHLRAPTKLVQPFGINEWSNPQAQYQGTKPILYPRPRKYHHKPVDCQRAGIPGAPYNDPFLQKPRDTVGGCKYGGVSLSEMANKYGSKNEEIFKPFYPQRSPMRLPSIQREKYKNFMNDSENVLPDTEIAKHIGLFQKQKNSQLESIKSKESTKRRERVKKEQMFQEWQQTQDIYNTRKLPGINRNADLILLKNQVKFHEVDKTTGTQAEKKLPDITQKENRQLVNENDKEADLIPICHVKFAPGTKNEKSKQKSKKKHKLKKKKM